MFQCPLNCPALPASSLSIATCKLNWGVPSQSNNLGWEVYRSVDGTVFERVGDMIDGEGTTDMYEVYSFTDSELPLADVVHYYLKQVDLDGSAARSQEIAVALTPVAVLPTVFSLAQNFPNPFNPATTISFDLASESEVSLVIYDGTGPGCPSGCPGTDLRGRPVQRSLGRSGQQRQCRCQRASTSTSSELARSARWKKMTLLH